VFVQFSDNCINDATGVWLKAYVVDGIQYILSFADPAYTENVIINLSYGPTTGPHDGLALLEMALSALVAYYDGSNGKPNLEIVLPAGNSYLTEGHVVFCRHPTQPDHVEWIWRLPPDNTVLCFAEVWTNDVPGAGNISVTLTSPSGYQSSSSSVVSTTLPTPGGTIPQLIGPVVWGNDRMWLLEVGPTVAKPGVYANEHGDWKIKVSSVDPGVQIDAYVARTDPNMGVTTGAKRSFFIDPVWEHSQSATASSTTERVLLNGALKTAMPFLVAVFRSIWLVPIQKAPITIRRFACSSTRAVTWVFERMPNTETFLIFSISSSSVSAA